MTTFLITLLLFGLLAMGMPVGFALLSTGTLGLYLVGGANAVVGVLTTTPLSSVASYELISIPLFILMAEFVILSGVADNLFRCAATWVGRVPGGLGMATALAGAGFGAISGSSTAAAATLSSTTMPAMLKQGYEPRLAGGPKGESLIGRIEMRDHVMQAKRVVGPGEPQIERWVIDLAVQLEGMGLQQFGELL